MHTITLQSQLLSTAKAVQHLAVEAGIKLRLSQVYTEANLEHLAVVSGLLRQIAEKAAGMPIEVIIPKTTVA